MGVAAFIIVGRIDCSRATLSLALVFVNKQAKH